MKTLHHDFLRASSLMELLVAMGIISTIIGITGVIYFETGKLHNDHNRYQQRVSIAEHFLRQIARNVRSSRAFLNTAAGLSAGPDTLILSEAGKTVVYHASDAGVERILISSGKTERGMALTMPGIRVSFDHEGTPAASARTVVTTAEWTATPVIGISHPTLSLRTALRNEEARP